MGIDQFLTLFPAARKVGVGWIDRCPAHNDRNPSLSISEGDDTRILLHCHAGCPVEAVCDQLGIGLADLMPARRPEGGSTPARSRTRRTYASAAEATAAAARQVQKDRDPSWRHDATYSYRDRGGAELMQVLRFEPNGGGDKTFRPISAADGRWSLGDPSGLLPPYRLPELEGVSRIVVVEGEKAADAGASIGLCTTTSAHGARSAAKTDWTPLAGCVVAIFPDNDEPGRAYASEVFRNLQALDPPARVRIVALPGLEEGGDLHDFVAQRRSAGLSSEAILTQLGALIEAAAEETPPTVRERIRLEPDRHITLDRLDRLFGEHVPPLVYRRGGSLMQVVRLEPDLGDRQVSRPLGAAIARPMDAYGLCDAMNKVAQFEAKRVRGKAEEVLQIPAPLPVARELLARGQWTSIPPLAAILSGPAILGDGTLVARDGYHRESGLFLDLGGLELGAIPDQPTRAQAEAALDELRGLIKSFPFVESTDRAVALAALITPPARQCFPHSPLLGYSAPSPGTGKSILCDLTAILATGRIAPAITPAADEEENRKLIFALLLEASPVIVLDNCVRPVGGAALCSALTQEFVRGRVLGVSATATISTRHTTMLASGNNLVLAGDIRRRGLTCRLDAACERPWERRFETDARQLALARRAELLRASLTVLRWGMVQGVRARDLPPWGGFEGWCRIIREPLVLLGEADPVAVLNRNDEQDPETADLRSLVDAWWEAFGSELKAVADAIVAAGSEGELSDALAAVAGRDPRGLINARRLGHYLVRMECRVASGRRFERAGTRRGAALWRLVTCPPPPGDSSASSASSSPSSIRACEREEDPSITQYSGPEETRTTRTTHTEDADPPVKTELFEHRGVGAWDDGGGM